MEAALSGGLILDCYDDTVRDLASMHGSFRKVVETVPAAILIARTLIQLKRLDVIWLLDRPVSNSGRLKKVLETDVIDLIRMESDPAGAFNWRVELEEHVDQRLARSDQLIATADSAILDRCRQWLNLARMVIESHVPDVWWLYIAPEPGNGDSIAIKPDW